MAFYNEQLAISLLVMANIYPSISMIKYKIKILVSYILNFLGFRNGNVYFVLPIYALLLQDALKIAHIDFSFHLGLIAST